mgnify:CR=1 FL=1
MLKYKRKCMIWSTYIALTLLYAVICKLWLVSAAIGNQIIYVQGAKPVAKPAYYSIRDLSSSYSSILRKNSSKISHLDKKLFHLL